MYIELNHIVIRDFERKDTDLLRGIVHEKDIVRFMKDWSENAQNPENLYGFIDWLQTQKESTNIYENKRYAIALKKSDELIGMVGMGLEDTLHEVEVAYFMSEYHQRKGYTMQAVKALINWCFQVSDIPYLISTIDYANAPSCRLAEKCGFELFEKRTPMGHIQPNMESDSYYYIVYTENKPLTQQAPKSFLPFGGLLLLPLLIHPLLSLNHPPQAEC